MDKLRIGIIIEEDCLPTEGGGYSYYQIMLNAINHCSFSPEIELLNVIFSKNIVQRFPFIKKVIYVKKDFFSYVAYGCLDILSKLTARLFRNSASRILGIILKQMGALINRNAIRVLKKENIDLIYYLKPQESTIDYPLIVTHWDVGHKSMYPFPEVASNSNSKKREDYYEKICNNAFLILCESKTGADELLRFYPLNPDKIKVLPIFSGEVISQQVPLQEQAGILTRYDLIKNQFYLYPAQFWAHKNHYNLINAFYSLQSEPANKTLKLILCGADKGNMKYIKSLIHMLGLSDYVILPGFISNKDLYALYKNAVALVMPTFLGPTNLPLIEAAQLGCPVICSELDGHKEILHDTALYFDPSNASDIKCCMQKILNEDIRKQMCASAYQRISQSSFNVEKSIQVLKDILLQIKPIRKAWGNSSGLLQVLTYANVGVLSI